MPNLPGKVLLACMILLLPTTAMAQYQMVSPSLYEGPRISFDNHANRTQSPPGAGQAEAVPDAATFAFVPSRERRVRNLAQFVAKSRAVDPKGAVSLEAAFAEGDIIERIRPELAKHGLRIDNVADAYAVWWINAWQASRGVNDDVSQPTLAAVRGQVMRSAPMLARADDASKQEMSESLLIQSLLLSAAIDQAKGQPEQMKAVQGAAVQGAQGMGLDLQAMRLTENGFVPAR